jgi:hypothetical protein
MSTKRKVQGCSARKKLKTKQVQNTGCKVKGAGWRSIIYDLATLTIHLQALHATACSGFDPPPDHHGRLAGGIHDRRAAPPFKARIGTILGVRSAVSSSICRHPAARTDWRWSVIGLPTASARACATG